MPRDIRTVVVVTSTQARNNFFKILEHVFNENVVYEITKSRVPVVHLMKVTKLRRKPYNEIAVRSWTSDEILD